MSHDRSLQGGKTRIQSRRTRRNSCDGRRFGLDFALLAIIVVVSIAVIVGVTTIIVIIAVFM